MIKKFSEKIKLSKEGWKDISYIAATIIVVAVIAGFFIWSVKIVISAIDAAFFGINQNIFSEILSFDLIKFAKIAPRLNIRFPLEEGIGISNPSEIALPSVAEGSTSTITQLIEQPKEIAVDISKISLKILNGTKILGLAGNWKNKFMEAGFITENISTGNADKKDYLNISISYNASSEALAKISDVLQSENLSIKASKDIKLSENSFVIIIGK